MKGDKTGKEKEMNGDKIGKEKETKKKTIKKKRSFSCYLKKLTDETKSGVRIGKKACIILDQIINDIIIRTTEQASTIARINNRKGINRDLTISAFMLCIKDRVLQKEMDLYAKKAVQNFESSKQQ